MVNLIKHIKELGDNHETIKGASCMAAAFFMYATISAIFKGLEQDYSMLQVVFFRNIFALLPYAIIMSKTNKWHTLKNPPIKLHFLRAAVGVTGITCLFQSLSLLPLADVTVLSFTISLFMALLSVPMLQERISVRNMLAILVGFLGVIIVADPTGGGSAIGYASGLCFGLFEAFVILKGRLMTRDNSNAAIVFYYAFFLVSYLFGVFTLYLGNSDLERSNNTHYIGFMWWLGAIFSNCRRALCPRWSFRAHDIHNIVMGRPLWLLLFWGSTTGECLVGWGVCYSEWPLCGEL